MKKTILILTFAIHSLTYLNAQISFSCINRQNCIYNKVLEIFENCEKYQESSLFVINKDETMLFHTVETMKSTYYITSREYDNEAELWLYHVTSDVGNNYLYIFNPKDKEIAVLYEKDGKTKRILFTIKAIF